MRSLAIVVPRADAELAHRWLKESGRLRGDLRVRRTGDTVAFPVSGPTEVPIATAQQLELEFDAIPDPLPSDYRELLELPEELVPLLPRSFDVIGDVVILRVPGALEPYRGAIGDALLRFVPGARVVADDRGVRGTARIRELVRLAGSGDFRTVIRENGLSFAVDLGRAYFSPRLGREHARVAAMARAGERVYDLCCGVGPFGITIASRAPVREVVLVDSNPAAIELARENLRRLGGSVPISAVEADLATFLATAVPADRVVFNLPHEGIKYATQVVAVVARGGTLHYYEMMERSERPARVAALIRELPPKGAWTCVEDHIVHPYSPGSDLVGLTLTRSGE